MCRKMPSLERNQGTQPPERSGDRYRDRLPRETYGVSDGMAKDLISQGKAVRKRTTNPKRGTVWNANREICEYGDEPVR